MTPEVDQGRGGDLYVEGRESRRSYERTRGCGDKFLQVIQERR